MNRSQGINRRDFLIHLGSGIVILTSANPLVLLAQHAKFIYPEDFNAYLAIGTNGRITVFSGKIEMGQGVLTSQAQMVADELDVPLSSIDMVLGDTDFCPYDMGTFGSLTTRMFGPALRTAAAQARWTLLNLAARQFNVSSDQLQINAGVITVTAHPDQQVSYAELSHSASLIHVTSHKAILKTAAEFHQMGTSPARLDAREKVTGAAKYSADIRLPDMLYARLLRPPMHGATLLQVDTSGLEKLSGVTLVNEKELVAVLHANPESAAAALSRIKAEWKLPDKTLNPKNIYQHLRNQLTDMKLLVNQGNLQEGHDKAAQLIESNYTKGYVAHAPIEPHAALADYKNGKITIWASTQTPFPTRDRVAGLLDLPQKNVRVITPFLGGGFGGKSADQQVMEAARLSKIVGHPVQVAWTREEEFFYDRFDPASTVHVISGTDQNGQIVTWDYTVYAAGDRGAVSAYHLPTCRIRSAGPSLVENASAKTGVHLFGTGPWRGPGANMNVFAIESQMDIMASELKTDALTFRLNNLSDARMKHLFNIAADKFGWFTIPRFRGQGYGLACNIDAGTYVVCMAEVSVDAESGKVSVKRVVCAQDMGIVINPDGARMQVEGGITMGLGYALSEEIQFDGGEILDNNFNTYPIPRFSWVPKIEVVLVKNDELAPQGGGEPAITVTGAVLANAIHDATGVRLVQLPMTPERIKGALASQTKT